MLKIITHPLRYIESTLREKSKSKNRSSCWDETRDNFILLNPSCAACGSLKKLQVHHIKPFHLYPELELVETNLLVLCMDINECHLRLGHGGSFKSYNPKIKIHAQRFFMETNIEVKKSIQESSKIMRENNK